MSDRTGIGDRVGELRRAFDRSFAEPRSPFDAAAVEDALDIRVAAAPYALRVAEIAGLFVDTAITPLPSAITGLMGIAGIGGAILPVYDLAAVLGHPAAAQPRWIATDARRSLGLAFESFEGHLRVRTNAILPQSLGEQAARHVRDVVQVRGRVQPIVSVASILDAITAAVRPAAPRKEP